MLKSKLLGLVGTDLEGIVEVLAFHLYSLHPLSHSFHEGVLEIGVLEEEVSLRDG
jgi:hypothetical protein